MSGRLGMAMEPNIIRRCAGIENVCLGASIDALNSGAGPTMCMTAKLIVIAARLLRGVGAKQTRTHQANETIKVASVPTYSP